MAHTPHPLLQRIECSPDACAGAARIKGTRVDVSIILDSLADGMTPDEIVDHLPQLTKEDVQAAIVDDTRVRIRRPTE